MVAQTVVLPPGALLVWCTDGLVERRCEVIDTGLDRLVEAVRRWRAGGTQSCCDHVIDELVTPPLPDDVVVLCVQTCGADRCPEALDAGSPEIVGGSF